MACFIEFLPMKNNHAGNKARLDINDICRNIKLKCTETLYEEMFFSVIDKIKYILSPGKIYKILLIMKKRSGITLLQYPFYFNPFMKYALGNYVKNNKTVLLLHDVDSLRALGKNKIGDEICLLNRACAIIVHNKKMKEKLTHLGVHIPMVELEIFDYLLDELPTKKQMEADVAFAGNLAKSIFLNEINKAGIRVNLYGPGYNENMEGKNVSYKGSYSPDQVPYVLDAKFGLIWDGDSLLTCSGNTGEYLKYNNPHKLSLYMASGLPVIVWKKSAIAEFVLSNNVGIAVDSIFEIKDNINKITDEQYADMRKKVSIIQKRVCNGYYTKKVIEKAILIANGV